ncbi:hypothetical protein CQA53_09150 [Helicobacter didelphidarum]|uniref:Uncharacterized protein n=1 Tax=Helicobacter didelphidarum TaxID=2040648 RepID=A0A3D8IDT9_9HELI|nr:hypothetical protein [Helicobacter didelphidarum]RDU62701.1 hypothetical protein CQA53_09150 [Helicobacter didelphidarum]
MNILSKMKSLLQSKVIYGTRDYKRYIIIVIFVPIPFFIFLAILLYLYDPMQVFHKPYWRDTKFFNYEGHARHAAKGVIDHYDFNSMILGSSMMFQSSELQADTMLGGKWVNFASGGMGIGEKAEILKYALKHKEIKKVIMDIGWFHVTHKSRTNYLYDDIQYNDMRLYFDVKFALCALRWSSNPKCIGEFDTYRQGMVGYSLESNGLSFEEGARDWLSRNNAIGPKGTGITVGRLIEYEKYPFNPTPYPIDEAKKKRHEEFLNYNMLDIARKYPNVKFYFIVPTYSRITYRLQSEVQDFYEWRWVLKYFVEMSKDMDNVRIYGFDDMDYADNLGNYPDNTHYGADMNALHIESIAKDLHILNMQTIDSYLETTQTKIQNYDLESLRKIYFEVNPDKNN